MQHIEGVFRTFLPIFSADNDQVSIRKLDLHELSDGFQEAIPEPFAMSRRPMDDDVTESDRLFSSSSGQHIVNGPKGDERIFVA
jgi:hypothetical protein